ncbi:MAG: aminodeoxychorismate/anthranilate synthase component II [Lachnospiraceae bacterium]|nr:aminodeoxychorismate/anthranilate synthase component II [Lachnospiraceae bacterium]
MYYMIDNYDSFVYNLNAYMEENGCSVLVRRADRVSFEEIESLDLEGIIISPGPGSPEEATVSSEILERYQNIVPILGVCLGHQIIGHHYGACVCHGNVPVHGKVTPIHHNNANLFKGLPREYKVTRYHSLVVSDEKLPPQLRVTARTTDGVIMGISHVSYPVYGIQFHPEAVLTEYGHELLKNFIEICREWKRIGRRAV